MSLFASFHLGSVLGIPIRIHWSAPIGPVVWITILYIDCEETSFMDAALSLSFDIALLAAIGAVVLMHELCHALAAKFWGVRTRAIYLHIFGGLALLTDPTFPELRPRQKIVVFAAGPLSNLLCCILSLLLSGAVDEPVLGELFELIAGINFGVGIFNLLPIWPLDGGQIFRAFLAISRMSPGLSERVTLALSLILGIPLAYLAWKAGAWGILTVLLILIALGIWLLASQLREVKLCRARTAGKTNVTPLRLHECGTSEKLSGALIPLEGADGSAHFSRSNPLRNEMGCCDRR